MSITITELYRQLFGKSKIQSGDVISMAEHGRVGGVSSEQGYKFIDYPDYAIKITESGSYTYIAFAPPGSDEADAVWKVMRLDDSSGLRITHADGDVLFNNIATNLTALSYS